MPSNVGGCGKDPMPELPEVETTRRLLDPLVVARTVTGVEVPGRRVLRRHERPTDLPDRLEGRRIERTDRVGKFLLMGLEGDLTWVIHLGMSGRLTVVAHDAPETPHTTLEAAFEDGSALRFVDPRTFGWSAVWTPQEVAASPLARLGPDALEAPPDVEGFARRLEGRRAPIKSLLLDQTVIAGLGNIYADEALHRARISPRRPAGRISRRRLGLLLAAIEDVLDAALAAGGTSLDDMAYLLPDGRAGDYMTELRVYGRGGEPCLGCHQTLRSATIGGRTATWCPRCQR